MAKTTDAFTIDERRAMAAALALSRRGLGATWPNPTVGCVLTRPDLGPEGRARVVGRGFTQRGGRPHGETLALAQAGNLARGATAYVTLEPCCHHGETPPCTDALIAAGITTVFIALQDPDPRVAGGGIAALRAAGIDVRIGLCAPQAEEINAGFLARTRAGRPLVSLKLATSMDGRIATADGDAKWITGPLARSRGHLMRAENDAILVGRRTVEADDPLLTCRLPGMADRSPVRIVLDSRLRLPVSGRLADSLDSAPLWLVASTEAEADQVRRWTELGAKVIQLPAASDGKPAPADILQALGGEGLTRLLIEGGGTVAGSFLSAGLVDRIAWFRAPIVLGDKGQAAAVGPNPVAVREAPRFETRIVAQLGPDVLEILAAPADQA